MPSKKLTDAFLRNVRLPDKPNQVSYIDNLERGLGIELVVSYGGTRTFRVLTYKDGKPQSRKLGTYPRMKVAEARAKAREYWLNPEKFEAIAEIGLFKEIAEQWLQRHVTAKKLRSEADIKRLLKRYIYPEWQNRRFIEIRRRDVNEMLDQIVDKHGPSQADSILAIIRGLMSWYQSRDENYTSPIVKGMKRSQSSSRARILDDDEIRAIWGIAGEMKTFGALIKIALLTAQRKQKFATMKWEDIKDGVWVIASEAREKGTAGLLKLPDAALEIINAQPELAGNPYVFAGSTKGRRRPEVKEKCLGPPAFNSWGQRKREIDDALAEKLPDMKPWTIHDLRRTARSLMSRAGVRPDIAERVLGHAIAGVEGIYDRHTYSDEKAIALEKLARLIEKIINPSEGNIVELKWGRS